MSPGSQGPRSFQQEWAAGLLGPLTANPSSPVYPFPRGAHSWDPRHEGPQPQTSISGEEQGEGVGGRVRTSALMALHPAPQTSPERGSAGLTGRGSGAAGARGPPFRLRWCRLWLGLRPGSCGAPAGLRRGSGSALARGGAGRGPPLVPPPTSGISSPHFPPP